MNTWTDAEVDKMKSAYYQHIKVECPNCGSEVTVKKKKGEDHLSKRYVNDFFFIDFNCDGCGAIATRHYKMSP